MSRSAGLTGNSGHFCIGTCSGGASYQSVGTACDKGKMDTFLKLFTSGYPGSFAANLVASLLGLVWTLGAKGRDRNRAVWRGWVGFWIGTGVFYILELVLPRSAPWWVAYVGLWAATWSLLTTFWQTEAPTPPSRRAILLRVAALVLVSTVADM